MRFQQISTLTQQYRSDSVWQNLNSSVTVSSMNAVKLQASNAPCYLNYRTRNRGKGWLDFVKSTSSADFAGWKGFAVTGLEVQMFNSAGTRIFEEYIVMYRSKVAGEWLSWVSNAGLDMMEQLQNEQNLGGTLDASSIYSGWESKGDIQALDIRIYKDNGTPDSEITPPAVDFYQQYRTNSTWLNLTQSVTVTNMNGLKIQTRNKPFYIRYRTRNRGKGWLGYVVSTNNMDYAGWKGYAVTGLDLQVFGNSGTRIYDTHAVMYRSKVAGEWLSWVSNVSLELMEKLQTENNLGGTLDGTSVYSGWESKGDIQAVDIRIFENIGTVSGEVPPVLTADFSQQYRSNSTWLELTPSVLVTSMNSIKLQTKNKPYYLKYRTNNRGKGWLDYVLSNSIDDFAGWKGFPLTGVEIQMFKTDGTQIYDQHAVMYRSKVAGEWLSWVSNVNLELMTKIAREYSLSGALDANSTYSGWASKGDIQAIEIRVFDNVGTSTEDVPTPPSVDVVIPNEPNNPNGFRIFIDAGHGGIDPGACNGSYYEKNYTLKLSLLQKQYFEQAGYRVTMSRETDVTMENNSKANLANKVNADLYIANHINAFTTSGSNGVEVYYQVNPSFTAASKAVARKAVANLSSIFSSRGIKTKTQDDGKDWFCVLREPRMPSILIEHGFISNASDLAKLNNDANLDAMAKSVVKAVCDTMPNPPIEVYPPEIEPPVVEVAKNSYLNVANIEALSSKLETQIEIDIAPFTDFKSLYTYKEAVSIVIDHDRIITDISNQFNFPKTMMQAILMRESYCYGREDKLLADATVMKSYAYERDCKVWYELPLLLQDSVPMPKRPLLYLDDSSTGIGQVFGRTAIKAHNNAITNGIKYGRLYDSSNLDDLSEIWRKLKHDNEFNIEYLCLVLICEAKILNYPDQYFDYTQRQRNMIFTRYNGPYGEISEYGIAVDNVYKIFEEYK